MNCVWAGSRSLLAYHLARDMPPNPIRSCSTVLQYAETWQTDVSGRMYHGDSQTFGGVEPNCATIVAGGSINRSYDFDNHLTDVSLPKTTPPTHSESTLANRYEFEEVEEFAAACRRHEIEVAQFSTSTV